MIKKITIAILALTLLSSALVATVIFMSTRDVNRLVEELSSDGDYSLNYIHPSGTHIIYVVYDLENVPELSTAIWRLKPFGQIDVEK